jgi:dihydroneopterin aldolase
MHDYVAKLAAGYAKTDVALNDEAQKYCWASPQNALELNLTHEARNFINWYINTRPTSPALEGIISIAELKIQCTVGVHAHEKEAPQQISVDLKVGLNLAASLQTDNLADTVSYSVLAQICNATAQSKHYHLIEALGAAMLDNIWQRFPCITWVRIAIKKPQAIASAAYAAVEFTRARGIHSPLDVNALPLPMPNNLIH